MIKITVNPDHEPKSFSLDLSTIVIGDGSPDAVSICFPCEGLHQNHLKIFLQKEGYWVLNQANDPFVTLNGQPFGKKKLEVGDLLQIRDHLLRIDEISLTAALSPQRVESSEQKTVETAGSFPDVENLAYAENPDLTQPKELKNSSSESLPAQRKSAFTFNSADWKKRALKAAMITCVLIVTVLGISLTEVYFRATQQNDKEEMLAAESLSDYAMALTYAKVFHIAPQKQNWMDPQFIKNNLIDILSTSSIPCGNIDMQGHFANCAYILRFYTNKDFSRFLLIAQPAPTISQWLIPKGSFLVDSEVMEIHKINDLRLLNRLLSNPNPLDGENGATVLSEIRSGEVLALDQLSEKVGKKDFSPPNALRYFRPGAENMIYNAPRYNQFGGAFLKAIRSNEFHNLTLFQSETEALSKFKNLLFYSTEGIPHALKSYHDLKAIDFPKTFLVANLIYSPSGEIVNSHLVLESKPIKSEEAEESTIVFEIKPKSFLHLEGDEEKIATLLKEKAQRVNTIMRPIVLNLQTLLENVVEKESFYLPVSFFNLLDLYETQAKKIREEIENSLITLRRKSPKLNEFIVERYLREYGLRDFYHNKPMAKTNEKKEFIPQFSLFQPTFSFLNLTPPSYQEKWNSLNELNHLSEQPSHIPYIYCPAAKCILR